VLAALIVAVLLVAIAVVIRWVAKGLRSLFRGAETQAGLHPGVNSETTEKLRQ
jgi:hypothetical protein